MNEEDGYLSGRPRRPLRVTAVWIRPRTCGGTFQKLKRAVPTFEDGRHHETFDHRCHQDEIHQRKSTHVVLWVSKACLRGLKREAEQIHRDRQVRCRWQCLARAGGGHVLSFFRDTHSLRSACQLLGSVSATAETNHLDSGCSMLIRGGPGTCSKG